MSGLAVALVHDYLTQRGGAERVVASMLRAFPGAPLHTSLFRPEGTLPEFGETDVRTLPLNRVPAFRRNHRLALPLLAPAFSLHDVDADVVVCSTSGWAHGVRARGRKVVYCHTPARWLYQRDRYLGERVVLDPVRGALAALRPALVRWDRRAARSANRYLVNSHSVARRVRELYGIEAEVLPAPQTVDPDGAQEAVAGLEPGFLLCVSRLLPYKNVDAVVGAVAKLREERLVVVGSGPDEVRLHSRGNGKTTFIRSVGDEQLRWLYANCAGLLSASYEDYGLTPLEAAAFGKPAAVLRWGGFLETVLDQETGVFFDRPEPGAISDAIERLHRSRWDEDTIRRHAERFSERRFVERLREIVDEEGRALRAGAARREEEDNGVLRREQRFHDVLAGRVEEAASTPAEPDELDRALFATLGPLTGRRVLELGCGTGDLTLQLLERGARVVSVDLSEQMLDVARRRVEAFVPEAELELVAAPVESTGLPDDSFDLVVGKWIIHHVDVERSAAEIARLLRAGGEAVFIENSGMNPILRFARRHVAGRFGIPGYGTDDEHPLIESDFAVFRRRFSHVSLEFPDFFFFTLVDRQILKQRWRLPSFVTHGLDAALWRLLPPLRKYSFHVLLKVQK